MADYYKAGAAITSLENIIDGIKAFVTAAAPGPAWVEDASYLNAAHPGEMFMANAGATTMYVYWKIETIGGDDVLRAYWSDGTGYAGGAGPTTGYWSAPGAEFFINTTDYTYTLFLFADEERLIAVLKGTVKDGAVLEADEADVVYQTMYCGEYTSGDPTNDTYPLLIAGNGYYAHGRNTVPTTREYGWFPETMVKTIGPSDHRLAARSDVADWQPQFDVDFIPPRNSRGSEAYAYQQACFVYHPGSEEFFALTGMFVTTVDVGLEEDVTIAAATYWSFPGLLNIVPSAAGYGACYLVPKGTVVP